MRRMEPARRPGVKERKDPHVSVRVFWLRERDSNPRPRGSAGRSEAERSRGRDPALNLEVILRTKTPHRFEWGVFGCGSGTRTRDLEVMGLASCQLLYPASFGRGGSIRRVEGAVKQRARPTRRRAGDRTRRSNPRF